MERDRVVILECNLDDMTGEALGYGMERLLASGALDVWFTPIVMKKSRPAVMLSVLCREEDGDALSREMLKHTTTLGVRRRMCERLIALREFLSVDTPWGPVRCKVKLVDGEAVSCKAEHDDCAAIASREGLPLSSVTSVAERLAWDEIQRKAARPGA